VKLSGLGYKFAPTLLSLALVLALAAGCIAQTKKKIPPVRPVDINTASLEQLEQLPGIGPVYAKRIIEYRKESGPFRNVDELMAVKGIGEKRMERLRKYVTVKNPTPTPDTKPPKQPGASSPLEAASATKTSAE